MKEAVNIKLRRRNLNTRKGKQRWRKNIVADEVLQEVEQINKEKKMQNEVRKKIQKSKTNELFVVDTDSSGTMKPLPLQKDRFKKKILKKTSIAEIAKIKKIKVNRGISRVQKKKQINNEEEITDIWAETTPLQIKKPQLGPLEKKPKAKAIILPEAGQSINPKFKEHEKFIDKIIVEQTTVKPIVIKQKKQQEIKKLKPKKKNLKVRLMERDEQKSKIERVQAHQFLELKKYKKEINEVDQKSKQKISKLSEFNQKREELKEKKGIVNTRDYKMMVPDFQLPSEVKGKLRHVSNLDDGKSLMREQYDNYFRRGLIALAKGKYKKRRIPKYKYHTTDREHLRPETQKHILGDIE